jgi:hypothetical protein
MRDLVLWVAQTSIGGERRRSAKIVVHWPEDYGDRAILQRRRLKRKLCSKVDGTVGIGKVKIMAIMTIEIFVDVC